MLPYRMRLYNLGIQGNKKNDGERLAEERKGQKERFN